MFYVYMKVKCRIIWPTAEVEHLHVSVVRICLHISGEAARKKWNNGTNPVKSIKHWNGKIELEGDRYNTYLDSCLFFESWKFFVIIIKWKKIGFISQIVFICCCICSNNILRICQLIFVPIISRHEKSNIDVIFPSSLFA